VISHQSEYKLISVDLCVNSSGMGRGDRNFMMDDRFKRVLHKAKIMGLKAGGNPMFKIPRYQVQHGASGGLPAMLWPDVLHTLLKGLIEVCIGWSLQMIQRISLLEVTYRSARSNIEDFLTGVQAHKEAFSPVRPYHFAKGVFDLLKDKSMKANKPVSGFMLGTTLAWHMPALLMQLMFAIGRPASLQRLNRLVQGYI
jgi:hypothetical protein